MDPNQIQAFLRLSGGLAKLVVISLIIERGLAFLFESQIFKDFTNNDFPESPWLRKAIKQGITIGSSLAICFLNEFDILKAVFNKENSDAFGKIITAFIIAGGSGGAIALFQGVMGFSKEARDSKIEAREIQGKADIVEAKANLAAANNKVPVDKQILLDSEQK